MVLEDIGKIYRYKRGNQNICIVAIPYLIYMDSKFPFQHKDKVRVRIEDKKIVLEVIK